VPDPASFKLDAIWDEEWEKNLIDAAMERVKTRVKADHYQIFYLSVVKKMAAGKVAGLMGVNVARVYLVKHRLAGLVKKELERLERRELQ
jgi:RNA polymerase sigma-70 factor (ECF subfamily)